MVHFTNIISVLLLRIFLQVFCKTFGHTKRPCWSAGWEFPNIKGDPYSNWWWRHFWTISQYYSEVMNALSYSKWNYWIINFYKLCFLKLHLETIWASLFLPFNVLMNRQIVYEFKKKLQNFRMFAGHIGPMWPANILKFCSFLFLNS
jgi:hypothetical protein